MIEHTEDPMTTLRRLDAAADLVMRPCPHCHARVEVLAWRGDVPRAVGVTHERGCPDFVNVEE